MEGSDMITITYVLGVRMSMKAVKFEFLTSMLWNEDWNLLQLSLNCLMMFEIFSKRWVSLCDFCVE